MADTDPGEPTGNGSPDIYSYTLFNALHMGQKMGYFESFNPISKRR